MLFNLNYITIIFTPKSKYYYVGKHSTDDIMDGYYGSGKVVKNICKRFKYKTRIVGMYDTEEDAYAAEVILVQKAKLKYGKHSLNFADGGKGQRAGTILSGKTRNRMSRSKRGVKWSNERKQNHSKSCQHGNLHYSNRIGFTLEHKEKISKSGLGKNLGKTHTSDSKMKMSLSKTGKNNPMYGKPSAMRGKPAPNRNKAWEYYDELKDIWESENMPSAFKFKKIVIGLGYPDCSYRGIIEKWQASIICMQA